MRGRRLASVTTGFAILVSAVCAEAGLVDPAPIPDEVVQRVLSDLRASPPNLLARTLVRSLDETVVLLRHVIEQDGRLGGTEPAEAFLQQKSLVASTRHQLEATRAALRDEFARTRARLLGLGVPDKVAEWDALTARMEDRFDRLLSALDRAQANRTRGAWVTGLRAALWELEEFHEKVKQREAAPDPMPQPGFRLPVPAAAAPQPRSAVLPEYLRAGGDPRDRRLAFLGGVLLAAAPGPTPPQAASCSYAPADLASNPEVQLTAEIRALAESLEYSPAKLYQYVLNEVDYEPYFGSLKGAVGTLVAKAGNATDQASLLIALLRASNIPARYVRGSIDILDSRGHRWVGAQTYDAAVAILRDATNPAVVRLLDGSGRAIGLRLAHVWVEACVPYGVYRGTKVDLSGHRWIPLDPSFKDKAYQPGIPTNVSFDFSTSTGYLHARTADLPHEVYGRQVEAFAKTQPPNFGNNTLQDVAYVGTTVPRQIDIVPASLPYEVSQFTAWSTGGTAETAEVPDTHRRKLTVSVFAGATQLLSTTLSYPETTLQRLTLSYVPATAADQMVWNGWSGNLANLPAGVVNAKPVLKVDGVQQAIGTSATGLGQTNKLILKVTRGDFQAVQAFCPGDSGGTDPDLTCLNKTIHTVTAGSYLALHAYALEASDRLLTERASRLLASVRAAPVPTTPPPYANDETTGEFLHLALTKYMRYKSDATRLVGQFDGVAALPGHHLGVTSANMTVQYVFDSPFTVFPGALYIDVRGGQTTSNDLVTGNLVWKTFKLAAYIGSALEHYIWQETARLEAVSTVRGIQYAVEAGIPIITLNSSNIACYDTSGACGPALMDPSMAPYKAEITNFVNQGFVVTVPRQTIAYTVPNQALRWVGAVYMAEKVGAGVAAQISGSFAGGIGFVDESPPTYSTPPEVPSIIPTGTTNSTTQANGTNAFITTSLDPVNLVTGNMVHIERDLAIKGRGGLPLVFERTYNSRRPVDGPLGFGWTHSFNHFLKFNEVTGGVYKVSWVDGTGGEKFFRLAVSGAFVPPGSTFTNPAGVFVEFKRTASGTYTIREKNGLTYTFESVDGSVIGQRAKLLAIADRNGNVLSMGYSGALLASVTDGLGRSLAFTYSGTRIAELTDWTGRRYQYGYDGAGNLTSFKNPPAVAGLQNPVTYAYYNDPVNPQLTHALQSYTLPRGNGMTFEYYVNGRVFRHYDSLGETTTFTYNEFRRETVTRNERGHVRRTVFDVNGNPTRIIEENGAERTYTYDAANPMNRLSKRDPMGYVTGYAYDANGNVTSITLPSGNTIQYSFFTAFNQPGKIKDARGNYTIVKYDSRGNPLETIRLRSGIGASVDPTTYTPAPGDVVAWTIATYDGFGNVLTTKRVRNASTQAGPTLTYTYDGQSLNPVGATRQGDKNGDGVIDGSEVDSAALAYDPLGRPVVGLREDWSRSQAVYDDVDRVVRATDRLGNFRDYGYDSNGNLASDVLTGIDSAVYTYDQADRRITTANAAGALTRYQYDQAGNIIRVTNPDGFTVGFEYDASQRAIRAYDEEGNTVTRALDVDGKQRAVTDPNGNTAGYEYYGPERDGRLKKRIDAVGRETTFDYDPNGNATLVTDNLGRTTLTTFDELDRPVRVVGPAYTDATFGLIRPVIKYTYGLLGQLLGVAAGRTDSSGTNPASDVVTPQLTYQWDDFGRKLRETDALGRNWQWTYDVQGNPITTVDPKGQVTRTSFGEGHQVLTRTDTMTGGAQPLLALTRASRQITTPVPPPAGSAFIYRGAICVANSGGACVGGDVTADPGLGPILGYMRTSSEAGTVPLYRATCYSDAAGTCTRWGLTLDVNGTPVGYLSTTAPDTPSAGAPFTQSGGLLLQNLGGTASAYLWTAPTVTHVEYFYTTDGVAASGYALDSTPGYLYPSAGTGRVALTRYLNTSTGAYYYSTQSDPPAGFTADVLLGYLDSAPNGGIALKRYFNASTGDYLVDTGTAPPGYVLQVTLGYLHTGNVTNYVRNALGQVLTAQSPGVTYTYTYDAAHRLASVTDSRGGKQLTYTYSAGGLLNTLQGSEGYRTDYVYDPAGRLAGIWAPNGDGVAFAYDAGGRLVEKWFPNGVNTQYTYNRDNTLARVKNRSGYIDASILSQHDYTYDGVGDRQTHLELVAGTTTPYRYAYDALDRLVEVRNNTTNALIESYTFDPLANRTSKTAGGSTLVYVHDAANQLTEIRDGTGALSGTLTYDPNGNLTSKAQGGITTTLTYDGLNRVTRVDKTGQSSEVYVYDGQGRRIRKTVGTTATDYLYDGPDIIAEYTTWTIPAAVYTHGPNMDDPLIRATATSARYYHQDGLGSVVTVTDQGGATTGTARYDAWGNRIAGTGTVTLYGYTGREPDATGLIYYRARYYDPALGRFLQRDPTPFPDGINRYAYVDGNPTNLVDPDGEVAQYLVGAVVGGFAGGLSAIIRRDSGWNVAKSIAIGAVTGAAVAAVGPGGAALANAIGNVLTQYATGRTDLNLTSIALAAAAGPAGKLAGAALQNAGVPPLLGQITLGLAQMPPTTAAAAALSLLLPLPTSTVPILPPLDPSYLPFPPTVPDPLQGRPIWQPSSATPQDALIPGLDVPSVKLTPGVDSTSPVGFEPGAGVEGGAYSGVSPVDVSLVRGSK